MQVHNTQPDMPNRISRFIEHLPEPDDLDSELGFEAPAVAIEELPFCADTASRRPSMSSIRSYGRRLGCVVRRRLHKIFTSALT